MSAWSSWTPCSSSCGPGTSSRSRTVTRPESNGGVSCPDLHQDKKCRGEGGCTRGKEEPKLITHKKHGASALRGRRGSGLTTEVVTFWILQRQPWSFRASTVSWQRSRRKRSMTSGRTSKLSSKRRTVTSKLCQALWYTRCSRFTFRYCVVFKVEKAMKTCRHSKDTEKLVRGELSF